MISWFDEMKPHGAKLIHDTMHITMFSKTSEGTSCCLMILYEYYYYYPETAGFSEKTTVSRSVVGVTWGSAGRLKCNAVRSMPRSRATPGARLLCPKLVVVKSDPGEAYSRPARPQTKSSSRAALESCLLSSSKVILTYLLVNQPYYLPY
jgi:hypothetical protein